MELSAGSKTLVAVAAAEAVFIHSIEIEPEHVFLGLLKIGDVLQSGDIPSALLEESGAEAVRLEVGALTEFWARHSIVPKQLRRRLRYLVSSAQEESGEFSGHRSPRGRDLYDQAAEVSRQRGLDRVSLMAFLHACLAFDSLPLKTLFDEFDVDKAELAGDSEGWTLPPQSAAGSQKPVDSGSSDHPLAKYGRDLTALARLGRLGPIIGRDTEIKDIARVLTQRGKNNPMLLGDPGVGKTAVVEGLAAYAAEEGAAEPIRRMHFVEITMTALIAGAMYRGQFEERVQEVLKIARQEEDLVLFIDEIHTMMGAGAASGGALDAANIFKPALARGEVRCIGATTTDEYRKHIEQDGALARRFQIIWIDEPDAAETLQILQGLRKKLHEHHDIEIPDAVIEKAVQLSNRFLTDGHQPDKAITLIDEACARRKLLTIHNRAVAEQSSVLEIEDIGQVIARRTQIPPEVVLASDTQRLLGIEEELRKRVLGQDHALGAVAQAIRISRAGLASPGKPVVLMFAGPTGTGKSELAKALSEFLFYSPDRLITLDMTEYQEEHALARIIGSPPGYIGFGEESHLVRQIRLHPYSVVLLDEIEKAHPSVMTVFMQVFDEGRLTDARGRKINCSEAIFILTSNLGAGRKLKPQIGFKLDPGEAAEAEEELAEQQVLDAIAAGMRPELVNRIQKIVVFRSLSRESLYKILEIYLRSANKRLSDRGVSVELEDSARDHLIRWGYSPEYGARHLTRAFERWVTEPLSRELLAGNLPAGSRAIFSCVEDRLNLSIANDLGVKTRLFAPGPGEVPPGVG